MVNISSLYGVDDVRAALDGVGLARRVQALYPLYNLP